MKPKTSFEKSIAYRQNFEFVAEVPAFLKKLVHDEKLDGKSEFFDYEHSHLSKEEKHEKMLDMKRKFEEEEEEEGDDGDDDAKSQEKEDEKPIVVDHSEFQYLNDDEIAERERLKMMQNQKPRHEKPIKCKKDLTNNDQHKAILNTTILCEHEEPFKPKFSKPLIRKSKAIDETDVKKSKSLMNETNKPPLKLKKSNLLSFTDE